MIRASAFAGPIVASTLFRPEFSHSLDPKPTLSLCGQDRPLTVNFCQKRDFIAAARAPANIAEAQKPAREWKPK
jgi:hypothetical protein